MMERAIYISNLSALQSSVFSLQSGFDRLYFGSEFCEWLIPSLKQVDEAMAVASENGWSFTLMTPYVSDTGLAKLMVLFDALVRRTGVEVVANDYGTLKVLRDRYPSLTPLLGRLLCRQKRGFGISSRTAGTTPELKRHFQSTNVASPPVTQFLGTLGVRRVELDNLLQGLELDLSGLDVLASIYTPYGYVTTTRFCPTTFDGRSWTSLEGRCMRACTGRVAVLETEITQVPVYMRGNTQFFRNTKLATDKEFESMGIDRIVFEPEVPA